MNPKNVFLGPEFVHIFTLPGQRDVARVAALAFFPKEIHY